MSESGYSRGGDAGRIAIAMIVNSEDLTSKVNSRFITRMSREDSKAEVKSLNPGMALNPNISLPRKY